MDPLRGHEGGVLTNGISPRVETLASSLFSVIGQNGTSLYKPGVGNSPDMASTNTLSFPTSRTSSIPVCCLNQPLYGMFVIVTQIDSVGEPGGVSYLVKLRGKKPRVKPGL